MEGECKSKSIRVDSGMGVIWFIGWLFTIAFAELAWWKIIVGIVIWPYFLGVEVR